MNGKGRWRFGATTGRSSLTCPPESGTSTYNYSDDGTLASKTAPKPNQTNPAVTVTTNFSYDEIHRLTQKGFTDGATATVKYTYDGVTPAGCTPPTLTAAYPKPLRTSMCDGAGASAWSYDKMGRAVTDMRTTNAVTKTTSYTYNLNGSLATLAYPSGRTVAYTYNAAARPVSATDTVGPINYATAASYAPTGALSSLTNGASLVPTFFYNNRLQPCRISVKSTGTAPASCTDTATSNVLDFTFGFNLGSGDNGNVISIANNRDTTRTQNFTYDSLNRIATAFSSGNLWGETFQIDPWGNLNKILAYTGKPQPENLNQMAGPNNRFTGMSYDAPGNLLNDGASSYVYNAENQITTGAGVTYTYDGDGKRAKKSNGKLYWYGIGSDPLTESDLTGAPSAEFIFFNGKRTARLDLPSATVHYYFSDHLGSASVVTSSTGLIQDESDYYPFGGERTITNSDPNQYKFTSKERDSESGLDNFGARFYSSALGRFVSADWSDAPVPVPYANLTNPQTLNLYSFVADNPVTFADLDGHEFPVADPGPRVVAVVGNGGEMIASSPQEAQKKEPQETNVTASDLYNGIGKEIANSLIGLNNLGNEAAALLSGGTPKITPELQPSTPGEKAVMNGTALAMLLVPESKAAELGKVGVALREEKIVKQAETVAKYSDGALVRSARKAAGQVEKHLDLLQRSASEAATSIKVDLRHNAERLEAIIRETVKRNLP